MSGEGDWAFRGIIEGFYGAPWSWEARADVMRWCHDRGMTHYLYAPKDDPLHRHDWRELYPPEMLAEFAGLVAEDTLRVGFALSPGLSIDYASEDDRRSFAAKVDQMLDLGIDLICLAVDDIPVRPGLGADHAALTVWLRDHVGDRATVVLVPTEYTGTASSPYLDALAAGVPDDVPIAWTGTTVVCDDITVAEARARAGSLGGRKPFIWDNYPVNDGFMSDRLFLGPLRGRAAGLGAECSGYVANPMVQPMSSKPALASIAAYLRGDAAEQGWSDAVDELGVRVVAEACDGEAPNNLVRRLIETDGRPEWSAALADTVTWLRAAKKSDATTLDGEADLWIDQIRSEADVGLVACKVLAAIRPDAAGAGTATPDRKKAVENAMACAVLWPVARRGAPSVMGPRCAFRPVLAQWPDGEWRYRAASLSEDANAIDLLVRYALATLDAFE